MTAEGIARALGGYRAGGSWMAKCPAHDDRTPSLSLRDAAGKVLVRCHAGCPQVDVIDALRSLGLWQGIRIECAKVRERVARDTDRGDSERTEAALRIWHASRSATGSLVEAYLASRGLHLPVPSALRFHPGLKHVSGGVWPSMVALVTAGVDNQVVGIHRTFLRGDGSGKAPVKPDKMMLGPCGGGAARLGEAGEVLMVGEGIETCLAATQATGNPAWAGLSAPGLRALDLSDSVNDVIVLADGDPPGEAAALAAAGRWKREGRRVRVARPPPGTDFNDVLVGNVGFSRERAS